MKTGELIDPQGRAVPHATWPASSPKGQVYLLHGYAEHYRRYHRFAQNLALAGFTVHAFDLPGHGLAGGKRGHIDRFQEYIDQLHWFIQTNPEHLADKPLFVMGHSMGGLISAHLCIQQPEFAKGLILSSPLTGFDPAFSAVMGLVARFLGRHDKSRLIPKPLDATDLTQIKARWPEYTSDPLRLNTLSPALFLGMIEWSKLLHQKAKSLTLPLLVFSSRTDKVVSPEKLLAFFYRAKSKDKELVAYADCGHEILQDRPELEMTSKILAWLEKHL